MVELAEPVTRTWDFPRSVSGIAVLVDYATDHQVAASRALAGTGLRMRDLQDPDRVVTAGQELRVVRNLIGAGHGRSGAGTEVGRRYHVSTFGIAGYALLSSRTVLDAMNFGLRYLDLTFTFSIPHARVQDGSIVIEADATTLPADVRDFLVERDLSAVRNIFSELLAGELPMVMVTPLGPLRGPVAVLQQALPQANPMTRSLCESLCADLASQRRDGGGLAQQVRILLTQRLSFDSSMAGVCQALGFSERTLRRRLGQEGTTFQHLLDEVRTELAERLLGVQNLTVEDVAQRLGYAEASSFIQAHRRWHGTTPTRRARLPA